MINVLSLFDGISCGQVALQRAGIKDVVYYASEINEKSIRVTQHNFPKTTQLGDVTQVKAADLPQINLLIGGSPCQDLSIGNRYNRGLDGERSGLFWEFARLVKECQPAWFLLENVVTKQEWIDIISNELGVQPILIDSALVSAQRRRRLYWTNIPVNSMPEDRGLFIKDVIFDNTYKIFIDPRIAKTKRVTTTCVKWDISEKGHWSQQDRAYYLDGKMCTLPKGNPANKLNIVLDEKNNIYRRCHPVEAERFQTLPDFYTAGVGLSDNQRISAIGDGWTVDVIVHILKHIPKI